MSDARAKAEARRAKILARESSMKVQAFSGDITLPVDGTPQERPLAKRRSLVRSVSERNADGAESPAPGNRDEATEDDMPGSTDVTPAKGPATDTEGTPKGGTSAAKAIKRDISDDPDVESIAQLEEKHGEAKAVESAEAKKELFKKLTPKKSLKEIEEEIARNTAKYDADTLKDDKEKDSGKGITKRAPVNKEAALKSKAAAKSANNINPTNVTRLIRMLVIICFGVYKGYSVVQSNISARDNSMIRAMETAGLVQNQASAEVAFDEFGDPVAGSTAEAYLSSPPLPDAASKPSRTWGQWAQYKITAPFESTLTAVGISYWVANMLSAGINSRLKSPPKSKGILEQAMALYQSGFEGLLERLFCLLGEYALHLGTIVLVVTVLTLFTEVPTAHLASAVVDLAAAAGAEASRAEL